MLTIASGLGRGRSHFQRVQAARPFNKLAPSRKKMREIETFQLDTIMICCYEALIITIVHVYA